ncbi:hypothetical protein ADK47_14170 [Streptomyces rimosus subsp. rimosus]|nr:hypothetical protein ADK78_16435 [Kitasatospora aureofaciens]KOT39675.1 hypothetical protein ADK42_15405 [Streptomyces rimosus subsp. rimosus]KOT39891.1 hypothetical protein ADK84_13770 [Streptomyces sp. NRRL WC-3701]KOT56645.1 hypothetical protein ADK44_23140 [Streptomyces rimosus subsp. rimosus]KOT59288.1 hypothetical protein ADK45_22685 [Streptomyces rimosus subsp. rimosus]
MRSAQGIDGFGSACQQPLEVVAHRSQFFLGNILAHAELRGDMSEEHVRDFMQDDLYAQNAGRCRFVEHQVEGV